MTVEEWRPVPGFADYEASSLGRIASIKRGRREVLKGGMTNTGRPNVLLYTAGHRVGRRVHTLVALTFLGPRPVGQEIRHLDDNPLNNAVANLAYGTHAENLQDQRRNRGFLLIVGRDPTGRARAVSTHCRSGHERTDANTYVYPDGKRACRPCKSRSEMRSRTNRAFRAANVRAA